MFRFVEKNSLEIRPIVGKISLEIRPFVEKMENRPICRENQLGISSDCRDNQLVETISLSRQSAWKFARLSRKSPWKFVRLSRKSASKFVQGGGVCYLACYTVYTSHRAVQMCKDRFRVSPLDPYATNQHGPTQPTVRLYPLCSQLFRHRIGLSFKERTLVNSGFRCVKVA